ncbi:MAG: hypothetical protein K6G16_03460, partial [Lachnospiraceae bacterium]|nr:hypothetical protein [Lachnospiraceae bacterium]MCR5674747.1 hypothetical protein [Lachnospiraceae bacterium]
ARGYTNIFSVLWLVQTVFMTAGILILTVLCVLAWRRRTWTLAGLWQTLMDKKYDFESRMRYTHDKWEHF